MDQRIVAFDIGDKRIGIAISDPFNGYAMPLKTYFRTGVLKKDVEALVSFVQEEGAGFVVCGLPFNADGTESEQTRKARRFAEALRSAGLSVVMEDERYTTREARRDLVEMGISTRRDKRSKSIDSIAAAYILEGYLAKIKKEDQGMSMKEESNDYEEDDNIVELLDEEGNTLRYEHLGTLQYKGEWYACFTPAKEAEEADDEDDEEGEEVVIFHLVGDEESEELEVVEDDALLDEVFAEFCNQYGDYEDAEDAAKLEPDGD